MFMLEADPVRVNGRIFSVGSTANVYYRVAFDRIEALGWRAGKTAADGVAEICAVLEAGAVDKTTRTITLDWYRELTRWHRLIRDVEMYGGIVDL